MLSSCVCTQRQLQSKQFRDWAVRMKENPDYLHRKLWEFFYIAQALDERGMLRPGRRGLGFAVGREPLPSLFASLGCEILATDLHEDGAREKGWVGTSQHAGNLEVLNTRGLCPEKEFRERVQFRYVDMNHLPSDLRGFDFVWSSCSIEHVGSIELAQNFMYEMTRCLKPGGVAVHTTEYNVSSNVDTVSEGWTVIFRRRDIEQMCQTLESRGHRVAPLNFDTGNDPADLHVDLPPYAQQVHLKLQLEQYTSTSIGIIVTTDGSPIRRAKELLRDTAVGKVLKAIRRPFLRIGR